MSERSTPLDWSTFLTKPRQPVDFLAGRLMVRGQQISLVGDGKAGKSLFVMEWVWRIAAGLEFLGDQPHPPLRVMYVDQENPEDDIQERLLSLGATADTLANLIYLSFPMYRELDTPGGAADLFADVRNYQPDVVVLDTISRMIKGKENEADTWNDLYRHTIKPLKRAKVSSIRLDHFGKDQTRGARGGSGKSQDVDGVWELTPTERGSTLLRLTRTHTRSGKGHDNLLIRRHGELVGDRWKASGTWHGIASESEAPAPDLMKGYPPAARRVCAVLSAAEAPLTVRAIGDQLAKDEAGALKERTIQDALKTLAEGGKAVSADAGPGKPAIWSPLRDE
jgi:hypothetical protein